MSKDTKISTPKPHDKDEPPKASPLNVTLPPIDATPEEISHALFQRPPLKKPKAEETDGS